MSNELQVHNHQDTKIANIDNSLFSKENFSHYMEVSSFLAKSSMVPKNMIGKPSDILIAMDMGVQLGIPMLQSLQDIAVINGKPCMYGDGLLAVIQGHSHYEYIKEHKIYDDKDKLVGATCTIKRKNHEPHTVEFTIEDAKKASLWGKAGPWSQYPDRMLQMRARAFCIRDTFADAIRGIKPREEIEDIEGHIEGSVVNQEPKNKASSILKSIINQSVTNNVVEVNDIKETGESITETTLAKLLELIEEVGLPDDRYQKAMGYYKAENPAELTEDQGQSFIKILMIEREKMFINDLNKE